jgi:hypothetical protein
VNLEITIKVPLAGSDVSISREVAGTTTDAALVSEPATDPTAGSGDAADPSPIEELVAVPEPVAPPATHGRRCIVGVVSEGPVHWELRPALTEFFGTDSHWTISECRVGSVVCE